MFCLVIAVKELNGFYHTCLDKCKLLKSRGVDTGGAGVDQQFLNNTADKLIYEHAIELVSINDPIYHFPEQSDWEVVLLDKSYATL